MPEASSERRQRQDRTIAVDVELIPELALAAEYGSSGLAISVRPRGPCSSAAVYITLSIRVASGTIDNIIRRLETGQLNLGFIRPVEDCGSLRFFCPLMSATCLQYFDQKFEEIYKTIRSPLPAVALALHLADDQILNRIYVPKVMQYVALKTTPATYSR